MGQEDEFIYNDDTSDVRDYEAIINFYRMVVNNGTNIYVADYCCIIQLIYSKSLAIYNIYYS